MRKPFLNNLIYLIERENFDQNWKFSNKNDLLYIWRDFNKKNCDVRKYDKWNSLSHKFHPYSILTGQTMVESEGCCVLKLCRVCRIYNAQLLTLDVTKIWSSCRGIKSRLTQLSWKRKKGLWKDLWRLKASLSKWRCVGI